MISVAVAKPAHGTHLAHLAQHALDGTLLQFCFESKNATLHSVKIVIFVTQFCIFSFWFKVCFGVPALLFVSKCLNESLHSLGKTITQAKTRKWIRKHKHLEEYN